MYQLLVILSVTLTGVLCESPCDLWMNDTLMEDCCSDFMDQSSEESAKCEALEECEGWKCYMEEEGMVVAGKLDEEGAINSILNGRVTGPWLKPMEIAMEKCSKKMDGNKCQERDFLSCIEMSTFINCPADQWNDEPQCEKIKKDFEKCI